MSPGGREEASMVLERCAWGLSCQAVDVMLAVSYLTDSRVT